MEAHLLAWELVCSYLKTTTMTAVFKTCRVLSTLSKRTNLWSVLMKRDFPEHYPLSEPKEHQAWYQELYQFGAYFCIQSHVNLYPEIALYTTIMELEFDNTTISTARTRKDSFHVFIRYPGQSFVLLTKKPKGNKKFRKEVLTDPRMTTTFRYEGLNILFIRTCLPQRHIPLVRFEKYDRARYDAVVTWLHQHFEVTRIYVNDGMVVALATMKYETYLGTTNPYHEMAPSLKELSKLYWSQLYEYRVYRIYSNRTKKFYSMLYAKAGKYGYDLLNEKPIPKFWSVQDEQ